MWKFQLMENEEKNKILFNHVYSTGRNLKNLLQKAFTILFFLPFIVRTERNGRKMQKNIFLVGISTQNKLDFL